MRTLLVVMAVALALMGGFAAGMAVPKAAGVEAAADPGLTVKEQAELRHACLTLAAGNRLPPQPVPFYESAVLATNRCLHGLGEPLLYPEVGIVAKGKR